MIEASDDAGSEFGKERLKDALSGLAALSEQELTASVMDALRRYMDTAVASDDICMVTIGLSAGAPETLEPDVNA